MTAQPLTADDFDRISASAVEKLPAYVRDVRRERALLAATDPAGEREARVPLSEVQARQILLEIAEQTSRRREPVKSHAGVKFDEKAILGQIGADPDKRSGSVQCPAHEDRSPSLSWKIADNGRVLLKCHAGCTFDEIRRAAA
jgi:hypothetical protein